MSGYQPSFLARDFGGIMFPETIKFKTTSMSWAAIGGPNECTLQVDGPHGDLWSLIDKLRCPVEIVSPAGTVVWWGYISEVRIPSGTVTIGVTIDSMYNDVAIAYSLLEIDKKTIGYRKTTTWLDDDDSVAEYGRKQFLSSQGNLSDAAATGRRTAILAKYRYPPRTYDINGINRGGEIVCRGWWHTLGWRYASIPAVAGLIYSGTSTTEQAVGSASTNTKVMMIWNTIGQSFNAVSVQVYGRKQGSPADNLVLEIFRLDDNDIPVGAALGSVSIAGSSLSGSLGWISGTLSAETQLIGDQDYGLVVRRSGSVDASNYYVVNANTALTSEWTFRIWNGSAWVARSPDADMPFRILVNNSVESTHQIHDLVTRYGEFITAVDIEAVSGVYLPSYRDGDTTVLSEIEALLRAGGANGRRLLANVGPDRRLGIREEPSADMGDLERYKLDRNGKLLTQILDPVELPPPVGSWYELYDVIPNSADLSKLNYPELEIIEEAVWTERDGLRIIPAAQGGPDQMFEVTR